MLLHPYRFTSNADPFFSSVKLLANFDGLNGSTVFVDSSATPKTLTAVGGAILTTAQKKVGTASLSLDGTTAYVSVPSSTDFDFGSGDFTIEAWIYPTSLSAANLIVSKWVSGTASSCSFIIYLSAGKLQLSYGVGSTNAGTSSTTSVVTGVWTHVAVSKIGTTVRYFINGILDATTMPLIGSINTNTNPLKIGTQDNNSSYFAGYMDAFRITKGVGRYLASFTPA